MCMRVRTKSVWVCENEKYLRVTVCVSVCACVNESVWLCVRMTSVWVCVGMKSVWLCACAECVCAVLPDWVVVE